MNISSQTSASSSHLNTRQFQRVSFPPPGETRWLEIHNPQMLHSSNTGRKIFTRHELAKKCALEYCRCMLSSHVLLVR